MEDSSISTFKIILALGFGILHRWHVSTLFENERHFSHLSELEREMSFRTEMGFYYSYYKTLTESESFLEGMDRINHDNLSQYPQITNAEKKYNLVPEINIAMFYHILKYLGFMPKPLCWQIERDEGLSVIISCEGLGVPMYFYLEFVWIFTLVTGAIVFLYSTNLSGSISGGLIAIASFFFNHDECTRVQWTPPLRESFAYPSHLLQMYILSMILKRKKVPQHFSENSDLVILISFCLVSWQFSPFVFITQTIAMLILKWLRIIDNKMYSYYFMIHLLSVGVSIIIKKSFFLLNSFHLALLVVSYGWSELSRVLSHKFDFRTLTLLEITGTLFFTKLWKILFINSSDYEHIVNILRSKVTNYKDFHTMLYTCAAEFDFLKYQTYETLIKTYLLPTFILAGVLVLYYWYRNLQTQGFPNCIEPDIAYNILQTAAFTIMAVFIMRLKLFMTPHICIFAGLACSKRYLDKLGIKKEITQRMLITLVLAIMSYNGIQRFMKQREIVGEYSNVDQEELFEWVQAKTPKTAVFAGKMSLMANLMLSTRRPIVNNPYYEDKEMRDRTKKVYEIFSRKSVSEVHETLKKLQVDYLIIEEAICYGRGYWKPGCKMLDLWDLDDEGNAKKEKKVPVCPILFRGNAHPFHRVYENRSYAVLQLNYTKYIEYIPNNNFLYIAIAIVNV
ncbi:PREDICTED: probable C-mannosyltransferase DPY19L1 [Ceratosolen solmsi marchali]|uniref:Probable C-mannosyltransferase DPY19L1 n=1 Tax=Ceratosolen solmsi marchali TaxID=326594 RepID=A0AAJ6YLM1_9HYME|nr:PREDICTED: probable C-mannosyltransferase DPY19L1 [Ceratosolen solmsi marchali]